MLQNHYKGMNFSPNNQKPEFGIRNTFKKLVISIIFSIFVVENQYIINKEYYHYGDYQLFKRISYPELRLSVGVEISS